MSSYLIHKYIIFFFIFKNTSKILFFLLTIFRTLIILSSNSWIRIWMGIEINLISFVSLILTNNKIISIESSILYFIFQTIASLIFLTSIIIYLLNISMNFIIYKFTNNLIIFSLIIKIGGRPIHFWIPLVIEGLNWIHNYLLITWQKIGPIVLIFINYNNLIIYIILTQFFRSLIGLNQISLKKLIAYRSINQVRWLLISIILRKCIIFLYICLYFIITLIILIIFNIFKLYNLFQLFNIKYLNINLILLIFLNILSIGGLPPFIGFFPKIIIFINLNNLFIIFIIIIFTLITLFFYLRIIYFCILINYTKLNIINKNYKFKIINITMNINILRNLILIVIILI